MLVGARVSAPVQTGPGILLASYTMGTGFFLGSKAGGVWHWLSTPSMAEVKERVELYLYSPSGPSWSVLRWTLPLIYWSILRTSKYRLLNVTTLLILCWRVLYFTTHTYYNSKFLWSVNIKQSNFFFKFKTTILISVPDHIYSMNNSKARVA